MDLSETQSAPLSDSILKLLKSKNLDLPLKAAPYYLAENFAYFSSWICQRATGALFVSISRTRGLLQIDFM
jgi:hypothetical protein